jgi:bifunctional DNase/RNase
LILDRDTRVSARVSDAVALALHLGCCPTFRVHRLVSLLVGM